VPGLRTATLGGLVVGGAMHVATALWQHRVLWPDALARQAELGLDAALVARLASARPLGLSLSPDLGAGLAAATAAAGAAFVVDVRRAAAARAGAAVVVVAAVVAVLLARSFGTALAIAAAVVIVVVAARAWRWAAAIVVAGGAVGVALATRGMGALATSAAERAWNWRTGLGAWADAPWTGHGLLRFAAAYAERRPPEANVTRYAHSAPVQILAETGVVGAVAVVVTAAVLLRRRPPATTTAMRTTSPSVEAWAPTRVPVLLGALTLLLRALVDYDLHVGQSAMIAALLVGLVCAREPHADVRAPLDDRRGRTPGPRRIAGVVAALAAATGTTTTWADHAGGGSLLARVDVRVALRATRGASPTEQAQRAGPFAARHPAAAVVLARAQLAQGAVDDAVATLEGALALDPGHAASHRLLVGLARRGVGDRAAREAAARVWHVDLPEDAAPPGGPRTQPASQAEGRADGVAEVDHAP
jgi:hypothetical protein